MEFWISCPVALLCWVGFYKLFKLLKSNKYCYECLCSSSSPQIHMIKPNLKCDSIIIPAWVSVGDWLQDPFEIINSMDAQVSYIKGHSICI